ncbi:PD-(D/E)XK nuclease family protein [Halobacterium wangiae]|uniref:PD-(D/E)XK nuclease family protein n=1 Tax=Halobacterium wangiae TaxID=2902623 RepID=UPI001E4E09D3|nr:PD-(D/E)XK nuclease family protein [Halobacterium wangiae]
MDLEADSPIEAGEGEVNLSVIQLVETSPDFRQWFVSQAVPHLEIEEYIGGIIQEHYAGLGESDIEFGFRTTSGARHLVLVENKIDASFQPNQIERYYNRGQFRVDRENWDSFTICLLAPERYVSQETRAEFDSVIHYEAVLNYLDDLPHDSVEFFQALIKSTEQKSSTTDASSVLRSIGDTFQRRTDLTNLHQSVSYKKRIAFRSSHPEHPAAVQYDVDIRDTGDDGRTQVRLQLLNEEDLTGEKREKLESVVSQHIDSLPDYKPKLGDEKKNIAVKQIHHDEVVQDSPYDSYIVAIADELRNLSETFHPVFVRSPVC